MFLALELAVEGGAVDAEQAGRRGLVPADGLELTFPPSLAVFDGRFANNGWLQELPDPITKLTWDNAALVSPWTAVDLGVVTGDVVALDVGWWTVEAPVFVLPGQADGSIALALGYGRWAAGRVGNHRGVAAYPLRTAAGLGFTPVAASKTGRRYPLCQTQEHWSLGEPITREKRPLIREATLEEYRRDPHFAHQEHHEVELFPERVYDAGPQWGMVIDLNACTGCSACVVACQSENNIPIVGKEQVARNREMHWLRVDRYFSGDAKDPGMVAADPGVAFQPMPCQQCENAPCEQVCPVAATVHDAEGLNAMVYNRCIGTRYCSNNCPYKVRRFNFFNYTKDTPELVKLAMNPDVLLLDDPFAGLDPASRAALQTETAAILATERKTCLLATDDANEALLLADRIVTLAPPLCRAEAEPPLVVDVPHPRRRQQLQRGRLHELRGTAPTSSAPRSDTRLSARVLVGRPISRIIHRLMARSSGAASLPCSPYTVTRLFQCSPGNSRRRAREAYQSA